MIQANCRSSFTAEDFSFIVRALSHSAESAVSLVDLLSDTACRDMILDQDRLREAVLNEGGSLSISPHLYFYVLTRAVLKETALHDRAVSDYVASLLASFSCTTRMESPCGGTTYLSDLLQALRRAGSQETFLIRAHVGNYSLFITGILHENVRRRSERGAPDVSFYEEMGSQSFRVAADHAVARRCELSGIFRDLGDGFREVRRALNRMSDALLHLGDEAHLPRSLA